MFTVRRAKGGSLATGHAGLISFQGFHVEINLADQNEKSLKLYSSKLCTFLSPTPFDLIHLFCIWRK